jgi:hypothetical protein
MSKHLGAKGGGGAPRKQPTKTDKARQNLLAKQIPFVNLRRYREEKEAKKQEGTGASL